MKGLRPPAVGLSLVTGCNVRRLGVVRKRSGVMCGWLCSRVRTAAPRPKLGGASSEPTDQALCGSVGTKKTIATMIELLSAWYIHE